MDGALNNLFRELLAEITGKNDANLPTGLAAQELLKHAKRDTALLTPDVRDWLKRVDKAAQDRNTIMHATAKDQCVICGNATQFEHKGKPLDRSALAVAAVSAEFKELIDDGVRHARDISNALNMRAQEDAAQVAAATGTVQAPKQVLIGQTVHRCRDCGPSGTPIMIVPLPAAVAVLPPA